MKRLSRGRTTSPDPAIELATDAGFVPGTEAALNGLHGIGIRASLKPLGRAAFYKADQEKQFKRLVRVSSSDRPPANGHWMTMLET